MAFTQEEQQQYFQEMYGCDINDFVESIRDSLTFKMAGKPVMLISLLSDVQVMVEHSQYTPSYREEARQLINRIKFLIDRWYSED